MFKIDFPTPLFSLTSRECRNDRDSLLQRFLCWLFGCCREDAKGR